MHIRLHRIHEPGALADFDVEDGQFRNFRRAATEAGVSSPEPVAGWFDLIGIREVLAAFYRTPAGELELFVDGQRVRIRDQMSSTYEPPNPRRLPWKLWGTSGRVLRFVENGQPVFEYRYVDESIWIRLSDAWGGFATPPRHPSDLLFETHRVLSEPGARHRIFR